MLSGPVLATGWAGTVAHSGEAGMEEPVWRDGVEFVGGPPPGPESVIDAASFLDGRLRVGNHLRIEGEAKGEIQCDGTLTIAEGALVNAQVRADNVVIAGTLTGAVTCRHRLEILPTGRLSGTITTGSIVIQEGALIEGTLQMRSGDQPARSDDREGADGLALGPVQ